MTNFKKIVVAGGGVLGSQIAYQAAYCGFDVTIWLRSEGSIGRCQPKLDNLKKSYPQDRNVYIHVVSFIRKVNDKITPMDEC